MRIAPTNSTAKTLRVAPNDYLSNAELHAQTTLISVVMPCLNESATVGRCIEQAHEGCRQALSERQQTSPGTEFSQDGYQIIVADNGSTDNSATCSESHGAEVVSISTRGYGAALLGGISVARGKYIVMADCDGSYDFLEIPRFIAKLEEGNELVMGNRFSGQIKEGAMPWLHRVIGNPLLSGIGRILFRAPCGDFHCGLRAFKRTSITQLSLQSRGMEFATELVARSAQSKLRIAEIPITLSPDLRPGGPHLRTFRDGARHLWLMLKCWLTKPRSAIPKTRESNSTSRQAWPTRIGLISIMALVLAAMLWRHQYNTASISTPLQIEPAVRDLGQIHAGDLLRHTFALTNQCDSPIEIKGIKTSCSCIQVNIPELDRQILPGQSISGTAVSTFSGAAERAGGQVELFYAVNGADDDSETRTWSVLTSYTGHAKQTYELSETSFDFGDTQNQHSLTGRVSIRSADRTNPMGIERVECPHGDIEISEISTPQFSFNLTPSQDSGHGNFGRHTATIIVTTNCSARPVARIPVRWQFVPNFQIPKLLSVRTNKESVKKIEVTSKRPSLIEITHLPTGCQVISTDLKCLATNRQLVSIATYQKRIPEN